MHQNMLAAAAATLAAVCFQGEAEAQDKLKLAVGQRGLWDTSISEIGSRLGIFKKHGLELEILYTQGSGETQQAVIANSVDIGVSVGTMSAIAAFSKGAPIRIIGAEITGAGDLYWYVKADSPIKTLADAGGKTISYSTNGASTHSIANRFVAKFAPTAKTVATGNPPSTLTQVMSGQVDVGWAGPPFGLDQLDKKEIRIVAHGNDSGLANQTVRVVVTHPSTLAAKKAQLARYMKGYREAIDAMYADPAAIKTYAEWLQISVEKATRSRDGFYPKAVLDPDKIQGLDEIQPEAVAMKFIPQPLTKAQLDDLIQIFPR